MVEIEPLEDRPIFVVGGGSTGPAMALELTRQGEKVRLDRATAVNIESRGIAKIGAVRWACARERSSYGPARISGRSSRVRDPRLRSVDGSPTRYTFVQRRS